MCSRIIFFSILLFLTSVALGQKHLDYNDGPYIKVINDSLDILWVESGKLMEEKVRFDKEYVFDRLDLPFVKISDIEIPENPFQRYNDVSKFVAISDIHGQHQLFLELLQAHQVIDLKGEWIYGDGHLIIVGDVMDRGDKVTETLWFLYHLEKQAELAGGYVHTLLGNHEQMVMHDDLRYVNPKYRYTSGISQVSYPDLFSDQTILGRWLRSKNIITVLNKMGFVHGGISPQVLQIEKSLKKINSLFKNHILPQPIIQEDSTSLLSILYYENGPLWYRGYADPNGIELALTDTILSFLDLDRIIVGHTSMPRVVSIHESKIILIDSSIKFGKSGEILIYRQDSLYRGMLNGDQVPLNNDTTRKNTTGPLCYVYDLKGLDLTLELDTDLRKLMGANREKEVYQKASLIATHNSEFNRKWDVRIRTRGNIRKKVCRLPPLKIDFSKSTLDYLGYNSNDKCKLVLPCGNGRSYQEGLYREHTIYSLYRVIDSLGYKTQLANVILKDKGKEKYNLIGFLIEDEKSYANRTKVRVLDKVIVRPQSIHRESYLKMMFFQFMILNTDFAISNKHNLEIIAVPGESLPRAIPYDFDYSGMVDQEYAVPHESFPIEQVRQPYFRGHHVTENEVIIMERFFNSKRDEIESIIHSADYLSKGCKKSMLGDIARFYKVFENRGRWKRIFKLDKK